MNPRRVATLLRELADALEEDEPANDREQPAKRRKLARFLGGADGTRTRV